MNQVINPMIFYWIEFFVKLGWFLGFVSVIMFGLSAFFILGSGRYDDDEIRRYKNDKLQKFKRETEPNQPLVLKELNNKYYFAVANYFGKENVEKKELKDKIDLVEKEYKEKTDEWYKQCKNYEEQLEKEFLTDNARLIAKPLITLILSILLFTTTVFIPSRDVMYKMLVASYVTTENYEFAKEELTDLVDYIVGKFQGE